MPDKDQLSSHLDNAMYGPQLLHPDEQRHYLGTFRERVSLLMTFEQVAAQEYLTAFQRELAANPTYQVIFNGHVGQGNLRAYIRLAAQSNTAFTIVQDDFYGNQPTDSGLVVVAKTAINVYPIAVAEKYPTTAEPTTPTANKSSWRTKFKQFFGQ